MGQITSCKNIKAQRKIIKQRLLLLIQEHNPDGYSISDLKRKLSEPQFGGFKFSINTIKRSLNVKLDDYVENEDAESDESALENEDEPTEVAEEAEEEEEEEEEDSQSLDLCFALAVCRLYDEPYDRLFAPPKKIDESEHFYDSDKKISPSGVLLNQKFMHVYTGYMSPRNTDSDRIITFRMELERTNGSSKATLVCRNYVNTENVENEIIDTFTGIPKVIGDDDRVVFIEFKNKRKTFLHFYFEYDSYTSQQMYFRRGGVFTQGSKPKMPVLLDFIMFLGMEKEPSKDEILGLLTLPCDTVSIPKDEMDALIDRDPSISEFVKLYGSKIEEEVTYTYSEDTIIKAACGRNKKLEDPKRINKAISCLMKLRKYSTTSSYVIYEDNEKLPKYAKDLVW